MLCHFGITWWRYHACSSNMFLFMHAHLVCFCFVLSTTCSHAWRNAYYMHDTNAFYRHESLEDHLFLPTRHWASWFIYSHYHGAPCMNLRRWCGPSNFLWQNDETNAINEWWHNMGTHAWGHVVDSTKRNILEKQAW